MKRRITGKFSAESSEDGFAAIVIALVLILVLSLITVGFAELMRHEERSALDKQLSSQAYYAAESGINDATKAINNGFNGSKSDCGPISTVADLNDNTVKFTSGSNPTNASYPCLLINPAPPSLHYDPIATTISRTAEFTAIDSNDHPAAVTAIKISWQDSGDNRTMAPNCNQLKAANGSINPDNWTYMGMLKVQLLPLAQGSAALDRQALASSMLTAYLCPDAGSTPSSAFYSANASLGNNGLLVSHNCKTTDTPMCNTTFNDIPADQSTFFINLRSIYSPTSVTVTAYNGSTQLRLKGAQTLIDSTGKAQDVLRRIQVRLASDNGFDIPDGTHADICKQFDLDPGATTPSSESERNGGCDTTSLGQ